MTCPRIEELSDFALGKLGEQSLEVVAEHLDACPQCQETVARLASDDTFVAKLKGLPDAPSPTVTLSPESQAPGRSGVGQRSTGPAELGIIGACQAASQRGVMNVSLAELAACVVDLECVSNAEISTLVESLPADKREDSQELARSLVQAQKVTKFQASLLLKGQGKSLLMGDYVVLDRIGAGGMGQVFRARHRRMDRIVAVKVISSKALAKPDVVQRFQREVKAAARLIHPHIVTAFDAGEQNGAPYLVMELVEGPDLATVLKKQGPLPVAKTLELIQQAARGLAFAHAKGVVHRDVKPGNLLVGRDGVKILDMGLARLDDVNASAEQRAAAELTQDGDVMGTIDYMAPEQVVNTRNADAKSDVYSLGCTLFRLLTGKQLFAGQTLMECIMAHREQPAPAASTYRPEVPPAVDQLIQRMVAKRPNERPTMTEVVTAIDQLKRGAPVVLPPAASAVPVAAAAPQPTPAAQPVAIPQATSIPQAAAIPQATTIPAAVSHGTAPSIPLTKSHAGQPPKRGGGLKWIAAAAGFLLVAFGVVVVIRDKDGNKFAEVNVPDGGSVTVENSGEMKSTPVEKQPSEPAPTTAPVQPAPAPVVPATSTPTASVTPTTMPAPATPIAPAAANGNYALQFDGRGAHALADLVPRNWQPPYTVEVWARVATSKDKLVLQLPGVVSLEAKSTHTITRPPTGPAVTTYHTSWSFFDESAQRSFGGSNPKDRTRAEWVHLAYVVESPQVCRLFIDGTPRLATLNRLANQPVTSTSLVLAQGGIKPTLLHSGTSQAWADFVGDIDEIRISANARYSSSFLPQRRFEPDAETLALYHFDEGQGNVFNDATGKQPPGRIVGAKWIAAESEPPANELPPVENTFVSRATGVVGDAPSVPTVLGHALQFNGINSKAVATLLDREWKPPYTFEAWVHAVPNERRRVFEVPDLVWMSVDKSPVAGLLNPIEWRFGMPPIDRTYYAPHPQYVSKSSWVHVAYSINSKDFVAIFVQGNQQMQYPHPAKNIVTGLRQLIIGEQGTAPALAQEGPFSFRSFQGSIDELRISSIARYNNSFMSFMPERRFEPDEHTVALYHFDEGVGDEFKDSSGNNQHGKLFGAKWISTTTPPSLTPPPVAVAAQPQPSAPVPATPVPAATPIATDYATERKAAEWAVTAGGSVGVESNGVALNDIKNAAGLPAGNFVVKAISLYQQQKVGDADWINFRGLSQLKDLNLLGTATTDQGLAHLANLTTLEKLDLQHTQITGSGVQRLSRLTSLTTLRLNSCPITDAGISTFPAFPSLTDFEMYRTGFSRLDCIRGMPKLQYVNIGDTAVRDLSPLADKGEMRKLNLWKTGVTDASLIHLKSLTKLKELQLNETVVTDAGLSYVESLPELIKLDLSKTPATQIGVQQFKQKRPSCDVTWSPGGPAPVTVAAAPVADPSLVCARLEAKRPPQQPAAEAIVFDAPRGDGRSGANGIVVMAPRNWNQSGTVWRFNYTFAGSAQGVHIIHPLGNGHVRVALLKDRVEVFSEGAYPQKVYEAKSSLALTIDQAASTKFPLQDNTTYAIDSVLEATGRFRLRIDQVLMCSTAITQTTPLRLTPPFEDSRAPATLVAGQAGVIIGPRDGGLNHAEDIHLYALGSQPSPKAGTTTPPTPAPITVNVQPTPGGFFGEASPNTPLGATADTRDPNRPRVDPPAADKLAEATKTVRELFKAEFAKKKPEEQRVLLTLLLGQGGATKDDLVGRFALLLEARNIAAELADVPGMTNAVASASDLHKIDEAEWLAEGVDLALKKPIAALNAKTLAKYLDERVTLALSTDNFTGGKRLLDLAVSASRKAQDAALTKSLVERGKAFDAQKKAFELIEKARATLTTSPADPAANLTLGKYWCFVTGEWPLGLAALAKCDDAQIVELAQASLANPQTPAEQVALADQWWSKVDKKTALTKFELQFAAVHWYQLAQGQADGLLKAKVEKRLTEAQEAIKVISRDARPERAAENTTASTAPAPATTPSATTPMPTSKPATPIAPAGPAAALGTPRQIAESYLKLGGTVRVKTDPQTLPVNVANLASLPAGNFTVVDLRLTNLSTVNDNVVAGIRGLPDLTHLYLNGSAITDQALAHATVLSKLEVVNLSGSPQLTDKVLFHLAQIKTLQQVVLNSASVSDRGLTQLKTLTDLENISLVGTQVTGSFLSELKGLEKLTQVNLANTPVDDRALGLIKLLPTLQFIDLSKTRITDAGLSQLKDHPALKGVYCADTAISDAGLKWLQVIPTLENVRAKGTRVTNAGVTALNQVLPKCRVER